MRSCNVTEIACGGILAKRKIGEKKRLRSVYKFLLDLSVLAQWHTFACVRVKVIEQHRTRFGFHFRIDEEATSEDCMRACVGERKKTVSAHEHIIWRRKPSSLPTCGPRTRCFCFVRDLSTSLSYVSSQFAV